MTVSHDDPRRQRRAKRLERRAIRNAQFMPRQRDPMVRVFMLGMWCGLAVGLLLGFVAGEAAVLIPLEVRP